MKRSIYFLGIIVLLLVCFYIGIQNKNSKKGRKILKENINPSIFEKKELDDSIIRRIEKYSCKKGFCTKDLKELRYLKVSYIDFNGQHKVGEIICNMHIADDLLEIFSNLYDAKYPIERIQLIDDYMGDDTISMQNNNTSAFNFRYIASKNKLSMHAEGLAIDINPLYNPQVFENGSFVPREAALYKDRSVTKKHMIDHDDLAYKLFIKHGFTWGGDWTQNKDYQHFEKKI